MEINKLCYTYIFGVIFCIIFLTQNQVFGREMHEIHQIADKPEARVSTKSHFERVISSLMHQKSSLEPNAATVNQDYIHNWAVYAAGELKQETYYGAKATLTVFGEPELKLGQVSAAIVSVANRGDGLPNQQNFIMAGWHVSPGDYGDTKTHFFTYWTRDGQNNTGCLNTQCWGFVLANNTNLAPGDAIDSYYDITIKIFKDQNSGDWWLYYGQGDNLTPMGYFAKWIFTNLQQNSMELQFGGLVSYNGTNTSPPMGSGHFPSKGEPGSASFRAVGSIDANGAINLVDNLASNVNNMRCYGIGAFENDHFLYGGPGGCR